MKAWLQTSDKLAGITATWMLLCSFLMPTSGLAQQCYDYALRTIDNQLSMDVARTGYKVEIKLVLQNPGGLKYVMLEKSNEVNASYKQCKYISVTEPAMDSILITMHDNYPLPVLSDAYYRVKTTSNDGTTKTYPPVRMPGAGAGKHAPVAVTQGQ